MYLMLLAYIRGKRMFRIFGSFACAAPVITTFLADIKFPRNVPSLVTLGISIFSKNEKDDLVKSHVK